MVCDRGTAKNQEDGLIHNLSFVGVVDAFSAPYTNKHEQKLFDEKSGGEMVKENILRKFNTAKDSDSLGLLIELANNWVAAQIHFHELPIERSDLIPAACFAIMKLGSDHIDVIQGGDCFVVWVTDSGEINFTKNQARLHEIREERIINSLLKKHGGSKEKMWEDFYPLLKKSRLRDINKDTDAGYAVVNGQADFLEHYQKAKIDYENLDFVIVCTDGFIRPELLWVKEERVANELVSIYKESGLGGILEKTRKSETKRAKKEKGYTKYREATGMVIRFQKSNTH